MHSGAMTQNKHHRCFVGDVMTRPLVTLRAIEKVSVIVEVGANRFELARVGVLVSWLAC